jgi:hypothetical protein
VVAASGLLVWSGAALAKAPPPKAKDLSAISQYRESIPAAGGSVVPGNQSTRTPLPAPVEQKVEAQGGSDTHTLKKIAEQSNFAAPVRHALPRPVIKPRQQVTENQPKSLPHAVFADAGNVVTAGESGHVVGLVVVAGLLALAAGAAAVGRRFFG